jgi:hypothetical protein
LTGFSQDCNHPPGALKAFRSGPELRLEIQYRGSSAAFLPEQATAPASLESDIENEESAAYVGLRNFLRGIVADRKQVARRAGGVTVTMSYPL